MSKKLYIFLAMVLVSAFVLSACGGGASTEAEGVKACQVTDVGGIDDKSFNATVWKGFEQAAEDFDIEVKYLESQQQTDYESNINAFIEEGCNLIVTVGYLLGDATYAAAEANPDVLFAIVDYPNAETPYDNLVGLNFSTDQSAFLAGYIAAATTQTGKVGTFGGLQIPPVTVFMDGFWYGVKYYNDVNGTEVEVLGWDPAAQEGLFTGNFESADDGRAFGESLMDEGADVILPVAGPVGLGTAAAIQERGNAWVIGVDSDWKETAPEYADIVLLSILKNMDLAVYEQMEAVVNGTWEGGGDYYGVLENNGVGMTPEVEGIDLQPIIDAVASGEAQTKP